MENRNYYQPLIRVKVVSSQIYSNNFNINHVDDVRIIPPSTLPTQAMILLEFKIDEAGFDWREFGGAMNLCGLGLDLKEAKTLFHPDILFRLKLVESNDPTDASTEPYKDFPATEDYTFILSGV